MTHLSLKVSLHKKVRTEIWDAVGIGSLMTEPLQPLRTTAICDGTHLSVRKDMVNEHGSLFYPLLLLASEEAGHN